MTFPPTSYRVAGQTGPTNERFAGLSRAQARVATLLLRGSSTREISREVGIVAGTVKHHVARLLRAYGLQSRFQFIALHASQLSCSLEEKREMSLTARERVVARHLADGLSDKEIAAVTGRSISTIKHQLRSVRRKLGLKSRALMIRRLHCVGCSTSAQGSRMS